MKMRWLVAVILGFAVLFAATAPTFADDEGGDILIGCSLLQFVSGACQ
ncbi:MAG: hypothetical protein ACYDAB_16060 [bacterium]